MHVGGVWCGWRVVWVACGVGGVWCGWRVVWVACGVGGVWCGWHVCQRERMKKRGREGGSEVRGGSEVGRIE